MKCELGFITDEASQDLAVAVDLAVRFGCTFVDLRSLWGKSPLDLTPSEWRMAREQIEDAGLVVGTLCGPLFKGVRPDSNVDRLRMSDDAQRCIEAAVACGALAVRGFTFVANKDDASQGRDQDEMRDLLSKLDRGGLELMIENGTDSITPDLKSMNVFLDGVEPSIRLIWDPGSEACRGFDPLKSLAEFEGEIRKIGQIQVKNPSPGGRLYVSLDEGVIDWPRLVDMALGEGFTGPLSLETHHRQSQSLSRDLEFHPWGEAFSKGGLEPTARALGYLSCYLQT